MRDLGQQLQTLSGTPVLWLGLGNTDGGDDAAGLRLAQTLQAAHVPGVSVAGLRPEQWIAHAAFPRDTHLVFLDAAEFSAQPGAVAFLDATQIQARFPQISTHRLALSTLARLLFDRGAAGVWLLGIQPVSLRLGPALSPVVQFTVELLGRLIAHHFGPEKPQPNSNHPAWPMTAGQPPAPASIAATGRRTP
jgi:hydrogenase maturation protease